ATLLQNRGALQPQAATATIMFIDIVDFTALSGRLPPEDIVAMLNDYFSAIVEILETHNGIVTQFQGDAVLAVFNVPQTDPQHAQHALQSALEIRRVVAAQTFAGQPLACRIGINTGRVVAGNVGAKNRLNYTVHGDAVNVAARLEQLNKEYGTSMLVSETTAALLDGMELQPMGNVPLRGKQQPIAVFTVLGDVATAH
ncbi:MAG: adenylate/guanylate cyclase domain-containing protein, partial [Gammaproteobacteria bacterium]|nr:adenylate/guanylate cyclase domain-containing protein [Gammaproteobacteria bacterium]